MAAGTIISDCSIEFSGTEEEIKKLQAEFKRRNDIITVANADRFAQSLGKENKKIPPYQLSPAENGCSLLVTTDSWHRIGIAATSFGINVVLPAETNSYP